MIETCSSSLDLNICGCMGGKKGKGVRKCEFGDEADVMNVIVGE